MNPLEHEYKVMGLSAYTKSIKHINEVKSVYYNILDFKDGNFISKDPLKDTYFDLKQRLEGFRFDNIAAALQLWSTEITVKWIEYWLNRLDKTHLFFLEVYL